MSDPVDNPVDVVLTLLRIGPDDNRWNLPAVRHQRAICAALMAGRAADEPATFSDDEVAASRPILPAPAPEPVETEEERLARVTAFNQQKGRLL